MKHWWYLIDQPKFDASGLISTLKAAGFSRSDYENFYDRFLPGNNYPQFSQNSIWALMGYLAEGAFTAERLPSYKAKKSDYRIKVPPKSSTETPIHHRLKQEATAWLREKGVKKIVYEEYYFGGIADVSSEDGLWVVECGASRPDKVWDTIGPSDRNDNGKVVFFNDIGITIFSAGPEIKGYRKVDDQWRREMADKAARAMEGFNAD